MGAGLPCLCAAYVPMAYDLLCPGGTDFHCLLYPTGKQSGAIHCGDGWVS